MNFPLPVAFPPLVVTTIVPVFAPVGTVAVTCVSEFGVNAAATPPNVTFVAWSRPVPVIVTEVPTGPLVGENVYSNHGRGIFLINQLMDEVRFERNGTEIHMRKY